MNPAKTYEAIVIGASAGGIDAVTQVIKDLPSNYPIPLILVLHVRDRGSVDLALVFRHLGGVVPVEAQEKTSPQAGHLHIAPAGYHLLIERDRSFSLSNDEVVNWARPSIDVLFESAADAFGPHLVGVILTGANHDGAHGLEKIKAKGGLTIVQDPATATVATMPQAAIATNAVDHVLDLPQVHALLARLPAEGAFYAL